MMNELKDALAKDKTYTGIPTKVQPETGRINGVEALLRWHHPQMGLIPPTEVYHWQRKPV